MGPLGVVVIIVVIVCLISSAWLCLMMHRRTQASTGKTVQVWSCNHFDHMDHILNILCSFQSCIAIAAHGTSFESEIDVAEVNQNV